MPEILPHSADRDEWLTARRAGIGASEIAAVMGISPFDSPFSLYWRKLEGWTVEESEEMSTGTRVEPIVADWWADHNDPHENLDISQPGLWAHRSRPWQLATPDRLISAEVGGVCGPMAVLECKWTGSWDGWGTEDTDDIPVYYRTQVLWQCDVVGVDEWHLAALGPSGFRSYRGRVDEKDLVMMREAGRRFMARLEAGEPPGLDEHSATIAILKRLHPGLDDTEVDISDDIAAGYRRACEMRRKADTLKDRYEARLRAAMGRSRRAVHGDQFIASRSIYDVAESTRRAYTVDRLNPARSPK